MSKLVMATYIDYSFFLHPTPTSRILTKGPWQVLLIAFVSYLFMFCGAFLFAFAPAILKMQGLLPEGVHIATTTTNLLIVMLIGPILEELIFRMPMIFKRYYFCLISALLVFLFTRSNLSLSLFYSLITFLFVSYLMYSEKLEIGDFLERFWYKHFGVVFYVFALTFGFVHIGNFYMNEPKYWLLAPFIVAPQLFMGLCLSYVRVRFDKGLIMAILMHIFLNTGSSILSLLTKHQIL